MNPRIHRFLKGEHEVRHAYHMGWERLRNGDLIRSAEEEGFDVFITGDTSIFYQQNNSKRHIELIVLGSNQWSWLQRANRLIREAVKTATPGSYIAVDILHPDSQP